jgi:hypothetical protein
MVHKLKFCCEANVGFVEGDEEEGEDLMDIDEEDGGLLIEFCKWIVRGLVGSGELGVKGIPSHSTWSTIRGERILYQR